MLDAAVDDRPVLLWSEGPHAVWANSAAMEAARIDDGTPEPRGVVFLRDAEGNPSGVFLGRGLFGLFRFAPPPDLEGMRAGIVAGLAEARALGVTSIQEQVSPLLLPFLCELRERGELTLRFHVWGTLFPGPFGGGAEEHLANRKTHERADWITFGTLKGGVDGMPSLRTAALLEPYADDAGTRGLTLGDTERLVAAVKHAHERGLRVALHATGDAGVRQALDAFEAARADGIRDRIEHAFFVAPEDVARAGQVGAIVSVQPGFLLRDLELDLYAKRLGQERLGRVLPLRSLLDAGATLAFGTDFSLTPLDPRLGLQAAVARASAAGSASGFVPAERISLEEAVRAYTHGSAQAEGAGEQKGRLLPGMLADFVLLSRDVFAEPEELLQAVVRVTVVDGRIVHER